MSIPKHFLLSVEPRGCYIDIQTEKVVHTGVMFCLSLLEPEKCSGIDINNIFNWALAFVQGSPLNTLPINFCRNVKQF
jgi:hypothetical protein